MFKSFLIWVLFSIGQMLGMSFGVYGIRRKQRRHVLSNWIIPWCYMHTLRPLRYVYTTLDSFLIQFRPTVYVYTNRSILTVLRCIIWFTRSQKFFLGMFVSVRRYMWPQDCTHTGENSSKAAEDGIIVQKPEYIKKEKTKFYGGDVNGDERRIESMTFVMGKRFDDHRHRFLFDFSKEIPWHCCCIHTNNNPQSTKNKENKERNFAPNIWIVWMNKRMRREIYGWWGERVKMTAVQPQHSQTFFFVLYK